MSVTVHSTVRPALKVLLCQRVNLGQKNKLDVRELIQTARQYGVGIDVKEVTPNSLRKGELDADLTVINIAGLSQKAIGKLDEYVEESFLQGYKAKKRGVQSKVIIYDPTEVRLSRKEVIEFRSPPIVQALLNGKFFNAFRAGFLRIEPLPQKLFQAVLEVLKVRERERSIN